MKQNFNPILAGVLSFSVLLNIIHFMSTPDDGLNNAAKDLSKFGTELAGVSKSNPITERQKQQINDLARIPVPISKNIHKNAVMTHGTNHKTHQPVVLRSDTGKEVDSCGRLEIHENVIKGCDITIEGASEELIGAFNASKQPFKMQIKDGKDTKDATFVVEVKALYEGSYCEYYSSGGKIHKICWDIPGF